MRIDVGTQIRNGQPRIMRAGQRMQDRIENTLLELVEVTAFQQMHDPGDVGITLNDRNRVVVSPPLFDLLCGHTKQEEVFVTDFLANFDVGTIQSTDGHGTVHHELHVAGS